MKRVLHHFEHQWANFTFIEKPTEASTLDELFDIFCVFVNEDNKKRYFNIQVDINIYLCRNVALNVATDRIWEAFEQCYKSKDFTRKFGKCEFAVRDYDTLPVVVKRTKSNFGRIVTAMKIPTAIRSLGHVSSRKWKEKGMVSIDARLRRCINVKCVPINAPKEEQKTDLPWGTATVGLEKCYVYVYVPRVVSNTGLVTLKMLQEDFSKEISDAFNGFVHPIIIEFNENAQEVLEKQFNTAEESVAE